MYEKKEVLAEGKTKKIYSVKNNDDLVIIENKTDITALDDPELTQKFATKATSATTTTCRVFELLQWAGLPVACHQLNPTSFLAPKLEMIPLEVVARRYAVGSYLKRNPQLKIEGSVPHRFPSLKVEFFLKTTNGGLIVDGSPIVSGLDAKKGEEDPFIINPFDESRWDLYHSKKPVWQEDANLHKAVLHAPLVVRDFSCMQTMSDIVRKVFLVLEGAWANLGLRLIDFKIEFGFTSAGRLMVGDVIDNDSWRLRDNNWQELSKQLFRDGTDLSKVEEAYGIVAGLSERFHPPKQAVVIWRASEKDEVPATFGEIPGIKFEEVIGVSGHKNTRQALDKLSQLNALYPGGGVIICVVGRSNGLGPTLAAHTSWPVISVPSSLKSFPEDICSNFRMPSKVPHPIVSDFDNALLLAYTILGQKNPAVYMGRQYELEKMEE